jgi:Tol biopolymer transport system component
MSEGRIHVLAVTGGSTHVDVRAPGSLGHISWTSDGHRLLVPSVEPRGASLLSVDLQGNTHVLWQQPGAIDISGIPSRDGRRIAIWVRSVNANLWFAKRP